jgi:hypothetical protein
MNKYFFIKHLNINKYFFNNSASAKKVELNPLIGGG